jgi:hypothetical protein
MRISALMALMVPIALYCADFSLSHEFYRKFREYHDRPPHLNLGMVSELTLLFLTGVAIAIYRRATFREAVVQWCVPPALLLVFWTTLLTRGSNLSLGLGLFSIAMSFTCLLAWLHNERGGTLFPWSEHWFVDSLLVGFVNAGMVMVALWPACCCVPGLLIQSRH